MIKGMGPIEFIVDDPGERVVQTKVVTYRPPPTALAVLAVHLRAERTPFADHIVQQNAEERLIAEYARRTFARAKDTTPMWIKNPYGRE